MGCYSLLPPTPLLGGWGRGARSAHTVPTGCIGRCWPHHCAHLHTLSSSKTVTYWCVASEIYGYYLVGVGGGGVVGGDSQGAPLVTADGGPEPERLARARSWAGPHDGLHPVSCVLGCAVR